MHGLPLWVVDKLPQNRLIHHKAGIVERKDNISMETSVKDENYWRPWSRMCKGRSRGARRDGGLRARACMAAGMSMMGQVLVKAALMLRIKDLTEVRFGILHAANCNDHDRG